MQTKEYLLKYNSWKYFLTITCFTVLVTFAINYLFLSDGLYYQSLGEQLAADRIAKMIEVSKKLQWLGYIFVPIVGLMRICFTAICIYIGCFIAELRISFGKFFKIALLADFVFVLAGIVKLVILIFFRNISTLNDLQFQPFSLLELFDSTSIEALFIYPFTLISVFELLYWLALAWLLSGVIEKPFGNSLKKVASSYGIGLLLWVLFVMFLTVNLA
jgi:hypothetical protein